MKGGAAMKKMQKRFRAARGKLRKNAGETIAEALIALLIASIAIVMLANMIATSTNMVHKSEQAFDSYYTKNNDLTARGSGGEDGLTTLTAYQPGATPEDNLIPVTLYLTGGTDTEISYFENEDAPDSVPVISYIKK